MYRRNFAFVLAMAIITPAWSTAQTNTKTGAAAQPAAKPPANTPPTPQASNNGQGCCGIPWSGPPIGCPAGRHASGFCDTWRGGFIGLKFYRCIRWRYGYPYYGPSYPLFAQNFPSSCCHPIVGTVYFSGCGNNCGYWHGRPFRPIAVACDGAAPPAQATTSNTAAKDATVPPAGKSPPASRNTARLQFIVPENAEVRVDGRQTTRTGTVRQFVSPPLLPNKNFTYQITVRYRDDNGIVVENKRSIRVRANDQLRFDFTPTRTVSASAEH